MFERTELLFKNINKIKNSRIAIIGVGGVGGYVLEGLVRMGVGHLLIIDRDNIEESNLNRQILALHSTLGKSKVEVAKSRSLDINPNLDIEIIQDFLIGDNYHYLEQFKPDYIIDCCDTITTKKELMDWSFANNIKILSAMGCGRRKQADKLKILHILKTSKDPIARILRKYYRDKHYKQNYYVLASDELAIANSENIISSCSYVPAVGGLLLVDFIVNDILK